jgi:uncharacterized protein with FMN-binding domain
MIENVFGVTGSTKTTIETLNVDQTILDAGFEGNTYTDGIYTGSATGYGPNLTVEVTVSNNTVTSIVIVSHNEERSQFYQPAFNTVPTDIISTQSLEVDTVTGSTFSSTGIINAVRDALSQALITGDLGTDLSLPTRKSRH